MQTTFTYEGILRAVGRVLDESGVKSFSIRDDDGGLLIEGTNDAGEPQLQARYTVGDLYEMVTRDQQPETSQEQSEAGSRTLQRFLAEHRRELIGATR